MARFKKIMKVTGIVLLCLVSVIIVGGSLCKLYWGHQFTARMAALKAAGQPLTFAEMVGPEIPEKDNAAPLYLKAFKVKFPEKIGEITSRIVDTAYYGSPSGKDWANAEAALNQCSGFFKLIDEAQSKPKYYHLIDKNIALDPKMDFNKFMAAEDEQFKINAHLREAARLYGAKAVLCAHKGDSHGMASAIQASIRLGDVLDNRFLIDYLAKSRFCASASLICVTQWVTALQTRRN